MEPPELDSTFEYLVRYLYEVGPCEGEHELSFQELDAWCRRTGVDLDDFGSTALKQMSRAYLGMYHKARDASCPNPAVQNLDFDDMAPDAVQARRDHVAQKLGALFGAVNEAHASGGMKQKTKRKQST